MSTTRSYSRRLLVSLGMLAVMAALPAGAAELPKSTQDILAKLKLSPAILKGLDRELRMPADWVKGAKKEGVVKIISSWDPKQFRVLVKPFKERYPYIRVSHSRASFNARVIKPLIAFKEGRYIADILTGINSSIFLYQDAKALEDLRVLPNFSNLPKAVQAPNGLWIGSRFRYWCMAYNTKLVKKSELPKTWEDILTNRRWRNNKLGVANRPQLWLQMLWGAKGADWAKDYMRKLLTEVKPQFRKEGTNALISLVIAGEFDAAIPSAAYRTNQYVAKGAPIGWHCPVPIPLAVSAMGMLRGSPNANAAKMFANWFLSKEGQIAQFLANGAPPVHKELQDKRFLSFPDEIYGKKIAFRGPELEAISKDLFAAWNPLWDKSAGIKKSKLVKVKTKLLEIKRGGRILVIKAKGKKRRIKISGRRTKVFIKGALDDRGNLKVGMSCEITHPENGNEAKKVSCP